MARPKKKSIEDMNVDEKEQYDLNFVANHATLSDRISWTRKHDNMQKLIAQIHPVEEQIIELRASILPIYDEINQLRQIMVEECVHPIDMLVLHNNYIECKFCNKKFNPTSV
jgi:transcriptional regulator with GAF, ATPase, and Fis domain